MPTYMITPQQMLSQSKKKYMQQIFTQNFIQTYLV